MFAKLWNDESGVVAVEYLFLVTIVGLALAVGYGTFARAVNSEFIELSNAIVSLDTSYSYKGISNCVATSGATSVTDTDGSFPSVSVTDASPTNASVNSCTLANP